MADKKSLGSGLEALFGDNSSDNSDSTRTLRMSEIEPNKNQPRQDFNEAAIQELADSIREHGLIQPIIVRPLGSGYQIVAGERRWRACRMLGLSEVPAIIKEFTDSETAQIALIENIQREDLNPVEEASAYRTLMDQYNMTQDQLAKTLGKSRSTIANFVRLLNLPEELINMLRKGDISVGQAKAIAAAETEEEMISIAKAASSGKMTVRDIEKALSKKSEENAPESSSPAKEKEQRQNMNFLTEMQLSLEKHLQKKVRIVSKNGESGSITIDFYNQDDLSEIADKLTMY